MHVHAWQPPRGAWRSENTSGLLSRWTIDTETLADQRTGSGNGTVDTDRQSGAVRVPCAGDDTAVSFALTVESVKVPPVERKDRTAGNRGISQYLGVGSACPAGLLYSYHIMAQLPEILDNGVVEILVSV
jgi:hypothetical protein